MEELIIVSYDTLILIIFILCLLPYKVDHAHCFPIYSFVIFLYFMYFFIFPLPSFPLFLFFFICKFTRHPILPKFFVTVISLPLSLAPSQLLSTPSSALSSFPSPLSTLPSSLSPFHYPLSSPPLSLSPFPSPLPPSPCISRNIYFRSHTRGF